MKKHSIFALFLLLIFAFNSHAGTKPKISEFESNVELGMQKTEVIAALGSPYTSRRWKGKDRWTYHFHVKEGKLVKLEKRELLFKNGLVVYKGGLIQPKVSAEEQDKINEQENLAELKAWEEHKQKSQTAREEYEKWVSKVHGNDDDLEATVPQFKPVK